jgi:serine protease Do
MVVTDLPPDQLKDLKIKGGVGVESADGAAAQAGIKPGDVILSLNNVEITSAKQYADLVSKLDPKKSVAALVRSGEQSRFVVIRPAEH